MTNPAARRRRGLTALAIALATALSVVGCATLQELTALRNVDFSLAGATGSTLAGVPIQSIRGFGDLSAGQVARLGTALARHELTLETVLQVRAANPADNVQARLVGLDWKLFLDDRETIGGVLDQEYVLPPGQPVDVPVSVRLDLLDFVGGSLQDVVGLALAVAGVGEPTRVRLEATPSIQTRLGPIRYPEPIRIEHQVGG
jgi:hypothetical protein